MMLKLCSAKAKLVPGAWEGKAGQSSPLLLCWGAEGFRDLSQTSAGGPQLCSVTKQSTQRSLQPCGNLPLAGEVSPLSSLPKSLSLELLRFHFNCSLGFPSLRNTESACIGTSAVQCTQGLPATWGNQRKQGLLTTEYLHHLAVDVIDTFFFY